MNLKRIARLGLGSLFAIALAGALGCAEERPPINRVQADALDKHFFVGDDLQDPADDPGVLLAELRRRRVGVAVAHRRRLVERRRSHPLGDHREAPDRAQGVSDRRRRRRHTGAAIRRRRTATIVAAYKITSHFDIRRAYNPSTGEEHERHRGEHDRPALVRARVHARRLVDEPRRQPDVGGHVHRQVMGNITVTPLTYYDNDPSSDERAALHDRTTATSTSPTTIRSRRRRRRRRSATAPNGADVHGGRPLHRLGDLRLQRARGGGAELVLARGSTPTTTSSRSRTRTRRST